MEKIKKKRKGEKMEVKIEQGKKRKFKTGATKQPAAGKGNPSLVSGLFLFELWKHLEEGVLIHGARNWERGFPLSVLVDSLERHITQDFRLRLTDENHLGAIACCAMFYIHTRKAIEMGFLPKELDDRPFLKKGKERKKRNEKEKAKAKAQRKNRNP